MLYLVFGLFFEWSSFPLMSYTKIKHDSGKFSNEILFDVVYIIISSAFNVEFNVVALLRVVTSIIFEGVETYVSLCALIMPFT